MGSTSIRSVWLSTRQPQRMQLVRRSSSGHLVLRRKDSHLCEEYEEYDSRGWRKDDGGVGLHELAGQTQVWGKRRGESRPQKHGDMLALTGGACSPSQDSDGSSLSMGREAERVAECDGGAIRPRGNAAREGWSTRRRMCTSGLVTRSSSCLYLSGEAPYSACWVSDARRRRLTNSKPMRGRGVLDEAAEELDVERRLVEGRGAALLAV